MNLFMLFCLHFLPSLIMASSAVDKTVELMSPLSTAATWVKTSAPDNGWLSITSDDSGQFIVAISSNGVYRSDDYGKTWADINVPSNWDWDGCVSSSTGQYLFLLDYNQLMISPDYGITWSGVYYIGGWHALATDSTGQRIVSVGEIRQSTQYVAFYSVIDISTDFGETWERNWDYASSTTFWSVTSSGSGEYLLICGEKELLRSSDYGNSWVTISQGPNVGFSGCWEVVSSSSGQYAAVTKEGNVFRSEDYGVSWVLAASLGTDKIKMSISGQHIAAYTQDSIYLSTDFGVTWANTSAPTDPDRHWVTMLIDPTGEFITAGQLGATGGASVGEMYIRGPADVIRTSKPTLAPTAAPTEYPTLAPTAPTVSPTLHPTVVPTVSPTASPSMSPTVSPTHPPTLSPTVAPSVHPTAVPTQPTLRPTTVAPTRHPTQLPTVVPTAAQIYQTSVQQTLKGVTKSQYVADWEANNLAWCTAVAQAIDGAPEDCAVTSAEAATTAEALRRRLSSTSGVDIGYTVIFDAVALGHPGNPTAALAEVNTALTFAVASGNFSAALQEYALLHNNTALANVTTTAVTVASTYSAIDTGISGGSKSSSNETTNIIIGVVVGGGGVLVLIALCVMYSFYCAGSASAVSTTTHTRVKIHEPEEGVECVETANNNKSRSQTGGGVVMTAGSGPEATL